MLDTDVAAYAERWLGNLTTDLVRYAIFAITVWLVICVLFRKRLRHRKLREATPPHRQLLTEFAVSLRTVAIFSTVGLIMFALERGGMMRGPEIARQWGWGWSAVSLLLMILAHDTYFYFTHRAMHDPRLFHRFHRRHHRSYNPSPFSAYSFDIAEGLVQAAFVPVWMLLVPTSWPVVGLFMVHQIARNTIGHCGYELFPAKTDGCPLFGFMTTVTHHDLHHDGGRWNYGLYFSWWDRWMGTEHPDYLAHFATACGRRVELQGTTNA